MCSPTTDLDFSATPRRSALPRWCHRAGHRRRPEEIILDASNPVVPGGSRPRQGCVHHGNYKEQNLYTTSKAHDYYAHLGHHIVGGDTVCEYTPGKKRMQEPKDLKMHLPTCVQAPAEQEYNLACEYLPAWCLRTGHEVVKAAKDFVSAYPHLNYQHREPNQVFGTYHGLFHRLVHESDGIVIREEDIGMARSLTTFLQVSLDQQYSPTPDLAVKPA